jgi:hypothetical protein
MRAPFIVNLGDLGVPWRPWRDLPLHIALIKPDMNVFIWKYYVINWFLLNVLIIATERCQTGNNVE